MALAFRSNSAPLAGALFVQNPRRKAKASKRNGKGRSAAAHALIARIKAHARKNGRRRSRKNGLAIRTNGLAVRMNGLAIRMNGRRRKSRKNGLAMRLNGLAIRTNRRRRSVRRNGLAIRTNGGILGKVEGLIGKIPFVGKTVVPYVVPVVLGVAAIVPIHFALKYGGKFIPVMARRYVTPVAYTLTGAIVGLAAQFVPVGSPQLRKTFGLALVTVGAAADMLRYLQGSSQTLGDADYGDDYSDMVLGDDTGDMVIGDMVLGDGGLYSIGNIDAGADAAQSAYSDAELGDAGYSGPDFDTGEGEAALSGSDAWFGAFGVPADSRVRTRRAVSRHAGRRGHRWGWLVRMLGWERFRQVAAMPPEDRITLIQQLRTQAVQTVDASLAQGRVAASTASALPVSVGDAEYGADIYSGLHGAGAAF